MLIDSSKAQTNVYSVWLFPIIALFVLGVGTIIGYYFLSATNNAWSETGQLSSVGATVFEKFGNAILFFDWVAVIFLVVLVLGGAWWLHERTGKPLEFLGMFFMAPFIGFIAYIYNYIFVEFISTDILFTTAQMFPKITVIATNLHWVALVMLVIGAVVFFTKSLNNQYSNLGMK
jgi:hypothetical protein